MLINFFFRCFVAENYNGKFFSSNKELSEIIFKFQTFNPIKIDEEFTSFLNDSLCVVADETHT